MKTKKKNKVKYKLLNLRRECIGNIHDWDGAATIFNGAEFRQLAKKYNREPYDISMSIAYAKFKF